MQIVANIEAQGEPNMSTVKWTLLILLSLWISACGSEVANPDLTSVGPGTIPAEEEFIGTDNPGEAESDLPGSDPPFSNPNPENDNPDNTANPPENPPVDPPADPPNEIVGGCLGVNMDELEPCCGEDSAHCVPDELIPELFAAMIEPCPSGGYCVPDSVLNAQDAYYAAPCASLGGSAGACLSVCIPEVGEFASLLPQDNCPAGELCAPCINPITGEDIGVCGQPLQCPNSPAPPIDDFEEPEEQEGGDNTTPPPVEEYSCDNPPLEPVIDVSSFNPCCDGAHCVPHAFVPVQQQDMLDDCDGGTGLCVPDVMIETLGYVPSPHCELPGGIEGRCLSICIPEVAANADLAPQLNCAENERCTPCCNPLDGELTGACDGVCEQGPEFCDFTYESCCGGDAKCLPEELIPPDDVEYLVKKTCQEGYLCTPNDLQDPTFVPEPCTGSILFTNPYSGVCMPKCIQIPFDFLIWKGSCNKGYECVPCLDPLSGEPSGAPGC
jgi:hypothetical protein